MKKKIAVVYNQMVVGGAEKALLGFLEAIDTDKYDITLYTYNDKGAFFEDISRNFPVQFTECIDSKKVLIDDMKCFRIFKVFKGIYYRIMARLCRDEHIKLRYSIQTYPKFPEEYDCAIAYYLNLENTITAIKRINASKTCAIMHADLDRVSLLLDQYMDLITQLDKVFCVSNQCKEKIDSAYMRLKNKTEVMHNILLSEQIHNHANEQLSDNQFPHGEIQILTVGRLSAEKGQQMIPAVARMLLETGYNFCWNLVGDGFLRSEIEAEIQKYNVQDCVKLLGTRLNPYPYIKNCDIYVQPSFSECYCTTTMEAKVLCKPVVTTDAPGMREQFVSGENGLIVDAMTPEALFEGIRTLLDHPELRRKFEEKLKEESFDDAANAKELQKLYDFIES